MTVPTAYGERAFDAVPAALPLSRRSVSWKVMAEPVAFLGGGRALLLQVAHPKVGAGVEEHSSYLRDPWARLFRTVDVMAKLSFGTPQVSERQVRLLQRMHHRVVGTTSEGDPYDASDPTLLLWVWATLIDTGLLQYERVLGPLTVGEREQYYEESQLVAHACGVPEDLCPPTWRDFETYMKGVVAADLKVTTAARAVAHAAMVPPLPWPLRYVAAGALQLVTAGTLPASLRDAFGLRWDEHRARRLDLFFAASRVGLRLTPRPMRERGFRDAVESRRPLRLPRLQRRGAALTARRKASFERQPPGVKPR